MSIPGLGEHIDGMTDLASSNAPRTPVIEAPESLDQATISTANEDDHTSPTPESNSTTPTLTTTSPAATAPNPKLCCVCQKVDGKYKCPRCQRPYCSIPCGKHHKNNHPPDPPHAKPEPETTPIAPISNARPGTLAAAGSKSPFSCLDNTPELIALFKQFPDLPRQLKMIEAATHAPDGMNGYGNSNGYGGGGGGGRNRQGQGQWNQEKGWQDGVDALKKARSVYGRDGEGVREFGEMVLMLMEREKADTEVIQQEVEDENTRLIRMLLEQETASNR